MEPWMAWGIIIILLAAWVGALAKSLPDSYIEADRMDEEDERRARKNQKK